MTQKERCLIVISKRNYDRLRNQGIVTDSFDSVITNLLEQAESSHSAKSANGDAKDS